MGMLTTTAPSDPLEVPARWTGAPRGRGTQIRLPAHSHDERAGSRVVAELVPSARLRLSACTGPQGQHWAGSCLVWESTPRSWSTFLVVQMATEVMPRTAHLVGSAEGIARTCAARTGCSSPLFLCRGCAAKTAGGWHCGSSRSRRKLDDACITSKDCCSMRSRVVRPLRRSHNA